MVARNDIYWADLGDPAGRRPVCVLTRDTALGLLRTVTVAPITHTIRGIPTEVVVGLDDGFAGEAAVSCDNVLTIAQTQLEPHRIAALSLPKRAELDRALRYALDIVY